MEDNNSLPSTPASRPLNDQLAGLKRIFEKSTPNRAKQLLERVLDKFVRVAHANGNAVQPIEEIEDARDLLLEMGLLDHDIDHLVDRTLVEDSPSSVTAVATEKHDHHLALSEAQETMLVALEKMVGKEKAMSVAKEAKYDLDIAFALLESEKTAAAHNKTRVDLMSGNSSSTTSKAVTASR
ncbi:hypothetical protein HK104_002578 [Borealophlyctis nickersoniae]|nr:hypothetical protein HK104_002578 [Borealophlyctis nickersoniae]